MKTCFPGQCLHLYIAVPQIALFCLCYHDLHISPCLPTHSSSFFAGDNGTGFVKVGYAGENFPRAIFPSMVGRPVLRADEAVAEGVVLKDVMVGDEAFPVRHSLECSYPVENGIVKNWDDMTELWNYTFWEKMQINPAENKILLTEPPQNPLNNRKKIVESMFETYQFAAANVSIQAMLTLYAQGLLSGVVCDTGDGVTHVVPVYQGFVPQHLIKRLDVAGRHITRYLIKLLLLRGKACRSICIHASRKSCQKTLEWRETTN